jgi:hypothetical protein
LRDDLKKAQVSRRRLLRGGATLPILSVADWALQLRQAQAQHQSPTISKAPVAGATVMLAPTDSTAAIQTKLHSTPPGGTLVFPANSKYDFNNRTVKGRSGITILANGPVTINGAPGPGTAGAFDFGDMSNWTLRGRTPGQGFILNNTLVNADGASRCAVGNCVFNSQASNNLNGSAIRMTGVSFMLVINNDFNSSQGAVLGTFDWDNVTIDGNHFMNCWQPVSIDQGTDRRRGRNIRYVRNIQSGARRAGFETGGDVSDGGPGQYFQNLLIDDNWFVDLGKVVPDGAAPVSIVARANVGTKVTKNFFRLGTTNPGMYAEAIEIYGAVEVSGNLIEDFAAPFAVYGNGANIHDNQVFNGGELPARNTVLPARLPEPPKPVRMAW